MPTAASYCLTRVRDGEIRPGQKIRLMHTGVEYTVEEVGLLQRFPSGSPPIGSRPGQVGYVIAGIKAIREIDVGDTVTDAASPASRAAARLQGGPKPVVFSSIYPVSTDDYQELQKALDKLSLNDAALTYEKDSSAALGFGFPLRLSRVSSIWKSCRSV